MSVLPKICSAWETDTLVKYVVHSDDANAQADIYAFADECKKQCGKLTGFQDTISGIYDGYTGEYSGSIKACFGEQTANIWFKEKRTKGKWLIKDFTVYLDGGGKSELHLQP